MEISPNFFILELNRMQDLHEYIMLELSDFSR